MIPLLVASVALNLALALALWKRESVMPKGTYRVIFTTRSEERAKKLLDKGLPGPEETLDLYDGWEGLARKTGAAS